MYLLYSILTAAGMLLTLPYWLVQGLRRGKYLHSLPQRLGFLPTHLGEQANGPEGALWIHCVSVGEALAAVPLARRLKEEFPRRRLVITTTTATGQQVARERMTFADAVFYFPLDWGVAVRAALQTVRPALVVVMETEIWPNFLREAARAAVPVLFVNGRISERSFRRYRRWLGMLPFLREFLRRVLADVTFFLMQTKEDASRILALGAAPEKVAVSGNLKYDQELPAEAPLAAWMEAELKRGQRGPVIVAGSVVAQEEPLVLIAFGTLQGEFPRALLVLAPRKPERFAAAAEFIEESHRKHVRRSAMPVGSASDSGGHPADNAAAITEDVTVLLLDSVGELASLYQIADAVFVGGSLVPSGGHNILEPAAFGKVPLFGASMENFREIAARFLDSGAAIQVSSPEDLGVAWIELMKDAARRERMGAAARELVERNRGATERALRCVASVIEAKTARGSAQVVASALRMAAHDGTLSARSKE